MQIDLLVWVFDCLRVMASISGVSSQTPFWMETDLHSSSTHQTHPPFSTETSPFRRFHQVVGAPVVEKLIESRLYFSRGYLVLAEDEPNIFDERGLHGASVESPYLKIYRPRMKSIVHLF